MRKILLITFFSLLNFHSYSQINELDSLFQIYQETKEIKVIKKAISIAEQKKEYLFLRKANIAFGIDSYRKSDTIHVLESSNNLNTIFKNTNDSLALAKALHYKALYHWKTFRFDSTYYYYNESKKISLLLKDFEQVGRRLLSISLLQNQQSDFLGAEQSATEALSYFEPLQLNLLIASCYNNLGITLQNTLRYEEARESLNKTFYYGYELSKSKPLKYYVDYTINYALTYQKEKNYKKSTEVYERLVNDSIKKLAPSSFYKASLNVALNNVKMGVFKGAEEKIKSTIDYRIATNDHSGLIYAYSILAFYYEMKNQINKAKNANNKAIFYAKKNNNTDQILIAYKKMARLENGSKKIKYLEDYIRIKDSLVLKQRIHKNQFAKLRYEDEKKDIENANLKAENNRKELAISREKQQKIIGWSLAGFSLLFIFIGVASVKNNNRKKAYQTKLKQVEVREKERQQIAKSIHDEVVGDIQLLFRKLQQKELMAEAKELNRVKDSVRSLSHQLSSVSFDEVSFKNQLVNLVSDYYDASFIIRIQNIDNIAWKKINNSIKRSIFLSIREAIQNIDKYAEASKVILTFEQKKKGIKVCVKDDGKGFDVMQKREGIGLKNMKERIQEIQGTLALQSEKDEGTTLIFEIPLHDI